MASARQYGDDEKDLTSFSDDYEWIDRVPFTNSCLLLKIEDLLEGLGELEAQWGTAIEERFAKRIGFSPQAGTQYFPACKCVRMIVSPSGGLTISNSQLQSARELQPGSG